jgi:hypothetical protein
MSANPDLVRLILAECERTDFRSVASAHPEIEYWHRDQALADLGPEE